MLRRAALLAVAAALAFAAPASASLRDEVAAGAAIAGQLRAGTVSCADLSGAGFEHLGDYVMSRMTGSPQLHAAMNERMRSHIGAANEARMHTLVGRLPLTSTSAR
jgi:hypothetical protein